MWTEVQRAIISKKPGHTVVYAGPGSGKTAVLTEHIRTVLDSQVFQASQVMVLTFTRQAALELKSRLLNGLPRTAEAVETLRLGTFHAQMFRALLEVLPDIPVLLGQAEQRRMLASALSGARQSGVLQAFQNALTMSRSVWPTAPVERRFRAAAKRYEALKRQYHRWDFDDVLMAFVNHFEARRPFIENAPAYLLIDEFQDTNHIQWCIIEQLMHHFSISVFVVGDDDQAIYGFRGASPHWLLTFTDHLPSAQPFQLTVNFRSDRQIVHHTGKLIQHNQQRISKEPIAYSCSPGIIKVHLHSDEQEEMNHIAYCCNRPKIVHSGWSIAVLARTRYQLYNLWSRLHLDASGRIQLRTFHSAKGREWDIVHIVDVVSFNPFLREESSTSVRDIAEEERRLFYVAATRARHELHIHVPTRLAGKKAHPSPYVSESGVPFLFSQQRPH